MGFLISTIVGSIVDANKMIKQKKAMQDDTSKEVVVDGRYAIRVPSFLSPARIKNEDASLHYNSISLDVSFLVIDEPKSDFIHTIKELESEAPTLFGSDKSLLDKMATLVLGNMFDMDEVEIGNYTQTKINGLNAITLNAFQKRTFFKDAIYASFAFVEGRDTLYQIQIISGGTSIRKLADKLEPAIASFREL